MAHNMLNLRKIVVLMIIAQQTDCKPTFRTECYILVVNCVYYNKMQPLYIILKIPVFCSHRPRSVLLEFFLELHLVSEKF